MTTYQCWFFCPKLEKPIITLLHADSDAEARRLAGYILRDTPQLERVEAWRDGDFAFRANRHQLRLEMAYTGSA